MAPNDVGVQTRLAAVRMGMGDVDTAMGDLEHTLNWRQSFPLSVRRCSSPRWPPATSRRPAMRWTRSGAAQGETEIVENLEGLYKLAQIDFAGAERPSPA